MIKDMGRIAVIHRGEWEEGSSYDRLDVVSCGGSSYMCVSPTAERPPSASWKIVALKGDAFTYGDFTEEQIASLMQPATDAAKRADDAIGRVDEEHRQLEQIREESADAVERSKTAATNANTAAGEAKSAATKADTAAGEAKSAATKADTAAGEAKSAAAKADTAARKADGAAETAGTAADTATEAAKKADTAAGKADGMATKAEASAEKAGAAAGKASEATIAATNAATKASEVEAKLTGNILKGKIRDTFIHVDDAFPSTLLGIEIEGATEQPSGTGKNLLLASEIEIGAEVSNLVVADESVSFDYSGKYAYVKFAVKDLDSIRGKKIYMSAARVIGAATFGMRLRITKTDGKTDSLSTGASIPQDITAATLCIYGNLSADLKAGNCIVMRPMCTTTENATFEPMTGGKPSPSPDFPQDIKVIENATIKILGKNLMNVGINESGNSADNFYMSSQIDRLTFSFYAEKDWWTGNPNGPRIFVHEYYPSNGTYSAQAVAVLEFAKETGKRVKGTIPFKSALTDKYAGYICIRGYHGGIYTNCRDFMFSFGDANETYSEFKSAEQAITLPAEHPYLAKIGSVADEIKIDRDGNVSLIANVGKYIVDTVTSTQDEGDRFGLRLGMNGAGDEYFCAYLNSDKNLARYNFTVDWLSLPKSYVPFTTVAEVIQFMKGKEFFYQAKEPKTYSLGKINLPALPESVSNVWTAAEITPRTTIEYAKDVNIAIARIEDAIASIG